jgi:predicted CXXCH cytochrome family protein
MIKKIITILLFSTPAFSQFDSFHTDLTENCKYCHAEETNPSQDDQVIWQKNISEKNYIPYSSSTLEANISMPVGSSKLCLSCHDGVLSMGHFNMQQLSTKQNLGTDLSRSHPISFKYDSYLAFKDGALHDPATTPSGLGGTIASDLLVDGNLECISCHEMHNHGRQKKLLVMSNYRSRLCLTCHDK